MDFSNFAQRQAIKKIGGFLRSPRSDESDLNILNDLLEAFRALLKQLAFGSYNNRVEHKRTDCDCLTRDDRTVNAYIADPLCGFAATAGLYRDMLTGIAYIQKKETLDAMNRNTPILFVAGGADPVGAYGKGVEQAANAFRACGMEDVTLKLYPMCRHEILNEINNGQIWQEIQEWIQEKAGI